MYTFLRRPLIVLITLPSPRWVSVREPESQNIIGSIAMPLLFFLSVMVSSLRFLLRYSPIIMQ